MNKNKVISVFLSVTMLLSVGTSVSADFTQQQQSCPDYSELKSQKPDRTEFDKAIDKLNEISKNPENYSDNEVEAYCNTLLEEFTHIDTLSSIYEVESDLNVKDSAMTQLYSECYEMYLSMNTDISDVVCDLYDAGFENVLRDISGYDMIAFFTYIDSEEDDFQYTEETNKLFTEIDSLYRKYSSYTEEDFTAVLDGKTVTASDLFDLEYTYSDEELGKAAKEINQKRNDTLGKIYLEMLPKRQQIAEYYGYDNYAEFAYECSYMRDYTIDDIQEIYDVVKTDLCDLKNQIYSQISYEASISDVYNKTFSQNELIHIAEKFFSDFDYDYYQNFRHLISHHLYDLNTAPNKTDGSYVTALYDYSVPFLFFSPTEDFTDITNMIHELGHANVEYENPSSTIWDSYGNSIDTCEIHSQGLEALFVSGDSNSFSPEEKEFYIKYTLYSLLHSITEGCLYDEFQQYAYKNPDVTLDQLNAEYKRLCKEYGTDYSEEDYYQYDWVEIIHNYESPMYYISYATSGVSALSIWLEAMKDYDNAKEIYKKVVDCGTYFPYKMTTEECGIANIFDQEFLTEIAYQISYYYDNGTIDFNYSGSERKDNTEASEYSSDDTAPVKTTKKHVDMTNDSSNRKSDDYDLLDLLHDIKNDEDLQELMIITFVPIAVASAVYIIGLITVICIVHHSDKKKRKKQNQENNMQ